MSSNEKRAVIYSLVAASAVALSISLVACGQKGDSASAAPGSEKLVKQESDSDPVVPHTDTRLGPVIAIKRNLGKPDLDQCLKSLRPGRLNKDSLVCNFKTIIDTDETAKADNAEIIAMNKNYPESFDCKKKNYTLVSVHVLSSSYYIKINTLDREIAKECITRAFKEGGFADTEITLELFVPQ